MIDAAITVATVKNEGDRTKRRLQAVVSKEGSCSVGASCAFRHDDQEKGDKQQQTPSPTKRKLRIPKTATRQAQARKEKKVDLGSASFMKEDSADQVRIVASPTSANMTSGPVPHVSQ